MLFFAKIRRASLTWSTWRNRHKTGGFIGGVRFQWRPGDDYIAEGLSEDDVVPLQGHPDVQLEIVAGMTEIKVPGPVVEDEPGVVPDIFTPRVKPTGPYPRRRLNLS